MPRPVRQEPKFRRRRRVAIAVLIVFALTAIYLTLAATVFAPVDHQGASVTQLTIESRAVGERLV